MCYMHYKMPINIKRHFIKENEYDSEKKNQV